MDLPISFGALLQNLSKVLLDGLQAAQKRNYNGEDEFMHTSIRM